jgi:hypothetical protein
LEYDHTNQWTNALASKMLWNSEQLRFPRNISLPGKLARPKKAPQKNPPNIKSAYTPLLFCFLGSGERSNQGDEYRRQQQGGPMARRGERRSSGGGAGEGGGGEDELEGEVGGVEAILLIHLCDLGWVGEFDIDALEKGEDEILR